jgi:hypothetical protein
LSYLTFLPLQSSVYFVCYSYGLTFVTADALKKTALSAHDKPKKAPKRSAPKKKAASDSDEDMFAVSKKKVC